MPAVWFLIEILAFELFEPGMGIYKRKKESEQESYHARVHEKKKLGQENMDASKKKSTCSRKHAPRKRPRKKELVQEIRTRPRRRPRNKELVQEKKKIQVVLISRIDKLLQSCLK